MRPIDIALKELLAPIAARATDRREEYRRARPKAPEVGRESAASRAGLTSEDWPGAHELAAGEAEALHG